MFKYKDGIMNLKETTLSCEYVYKGNVINLRKEKNILPDGKETFREIVEHNGGVCVAAITDDNEILLVSQYRCGVKEVLTEVPAGKLEKGEDPETCGRRELEEETGYKAKTFIPVLTMCATPAYSEEKIFVFIATDLYKGKTNYDSDEFIEVTKMPVKELMDKIYENKITDGKTIVAAHAVLKYIEREQTNEK